MPELVAPVSPSAPAVAASPGKPSRAVGIAALIIALATVVLNVTVMSLLFAFFGTTPDWSFGVMTLLVQLLPIATPICGLVAIILGIVAAWRNRGRVAGVVAIVLGVLLLVYGVYLFVAWYTPVFASTPVGM